MGKVFDALEKFREQQKVPVSVDPLQTGADEKAGARDDSLKADSDKQAETRNDSLKTDSDKQAEIRDDSLSQAEGHIEHSTIDEDMIALIKPQSFEAEQFKILRTKLLFPTSGNPARSIMVTSAVPGEGKSFVAANLAISIAHSIQEHVLIIDSDMRMPSIHRQFGFDNVPGLSEYLANGTPLNTLLLKTKVDKLSILPAGKPPHNPSELLSSQRMSKLLEEVRERYSDRYIIIDSPPPKLTAEANAIARQVDGILLVVKYGSTPRDMVTDLIELLGKEKILGVVFNRVDMRSSNYFAYKRYAKYGKYYTKYHKT